MGNICPSQVHPQHSTRALRWGWLRFHTDLNRVGAVFTLDQSGRFGIGARQPFSLVAANRQLKALPTLHRGQRHRPVFLAERKDTCIVGSEATLERFDGAVFLSGNLAGTGQPSADLLGQVTGQAKPSANLVIAKGLEFDCVDYFFWCVLVDPVQCLYKGIIVASNLAACDGGTWSLQDMVRTWLISSLYFIKAHSSRQ